MAVHSNNGKCWGCKDKFDAYPGFYLPLRMWFEKLQAQHPEAHISCAGREEKDQASLFLKGLTDAKFGKSAHNWGAAIDIFRNIKGDIYDEKWFNSVIKPQLFDSLLWYGEEKATFYERPHIEIRDWSMLANAGFLKRVAPRASI